MGVKWGCSGGSQVLAESMAVGLVPSTLLTAPTMLLFPLANPKQHLPTATHSSSVTLPASTWTSVLSKTGGAS